MVAMTKATVSMVLLVMGMTTCTWAQSTPATTTLADTLTTAGGNSTDANTTVSATTPPTTTPVNTEPDTTTSSDECVDEGGSGDDDCNEDTASTKKPKPEEADKGVIHQFVSKAKSIITYDILLFVAIGLLFLALVLAVVILFVCSSGGKKAPAGRGAKGKSGKKGRKQDFSDTSDSDSDGERGRRKKK